MLPNEQQQCDAHELREQRGWRRLLALLPKRSPKYAPAMRSGFWHSRLLAVALLSVVSAVAITGLAARMQAFTVLDGDDRYVVSTLTGDPTTALQNAGLTVGEYDEVVRQGNYNELTIDRAFVVRVTVDGETQEVRMTGGTVGDALERIGVDMAGYRLVGAQMTDTASSEMDILLESAVSYSERTEEETLAYNTQVQYTASLPQGRVQVLQKGQDGHSTRVYRDTLVDGEVVATVLLSETRTEPVNEIRQVGTKVGVPMSAAPYNIELNELGQPVNYKTVYNGKCTAYTSDRGCSGTVTSTGRPAAVGVVAVNPKLIPYGTELYIVSADGSYVYGYAIAGDTGGAAQSGRITVDLFMDTYEACIQFGRRDMNVYVLN